MSTPSQAFDTVKDRAAKMAEYAKSQMAQTAHTQAEHTRDQTVETAEQAASAAHAASHEFDRDTLQAAALEQVGAQINAVAAHLRNTPVDEMVDDVAVFARKNPLLFLGGAALAGFAAARFLKSGEGARRLADDANDPWAGHLNQTEDAA